MKELIEQSIAHWERMRDDIIGCGEEPFGDYCALCKEYADKEDSNGKCCYRCPVRDKTQFPGCCGSPWFLAKMAWNHCVNNPEDSAALDIWRIAAQTEIDFLKSLL